MSIETISYIPKDELQKIIGQNIRKIAYEKNMNLMKLSEQVDISYEYLRCIVSKNGKKNLSFYSVYKFSKALDTTIDELTKKDLENF